MIDPVEVPVVRTRRLLLRGWTDADREPFAAMNGDPRVMRYFPSVLTAEQSDALVRTIADGWRRRGFGLWAVERLDSGAFIGFVGLSSPSWSAAALVEVGWRLAAEHWGQGFAPEAAGAALEMAFDVVALPDDEVVSFTTASNTASRRVMEKLGLRHRPERDFDHPLLPDWWGCRHVLYSIDRATYGAGAVAR